MRKRHHERGPVEVSESWTLGHGSPGPCAASLRSRPLGRSRARANPRRSSTRETHAILILEISSTALHRRYRAHSPNRRPGSDLCEIGLRRSEAIFRPGFHAGAPPTGPESQTLCWSCRSRILAESTAVDDSQLSLDFRRQCTPVRLPGGPWGGLRLVRLTKVCRQSRNFRSARRGTIVRPPTRRGLSGQESDGHGLNQTERPPDRPGGPGKESRLRVRRSA